MDEGKDKTVKPVSLEQEVVLSEMSGSCPIL